MANERKVLTNRFIALSGSGKIQSAKDVPMLNADLDTREKCTITREEIVTRIQQRDCEDRYIADDYIDIRCARYTLTYNEWSPQQLARWTALKEGAATAPTGSPANAVFTLTRSGTVSGGTFPISVSLEGRTVQTKPLAWNATAEQIEKSLTAARMKFIHPGDVSVSIGQQQIETLTIAGTANESENLEVVVTAAGMTNSPKTIQVAITDTDTAGQVAGKVRSALILDADVGHAATGFFTVSGDDEDVVLTAKAAAANDGTMEVTYENAHGMTGGTSANTQAGIAEDDWTAGARIEFQGRLANAPITNLSVNNDAITGGGDIEVTPTTPGSQRLHEFARSVSDTKALMSFALGWVDDEDRVEKYINYAVESVTPNVPLEGNATLVVTLLGPWEYDSIEETFDIPVCVVPKAIKASDCRIQIDGTWMTEDVNSLSAPINDAIPLDKLSAFSFDGMDIENIERGRQPTDGPLPMSLFGSEVAEIYDICQNERTADPVPVVFHFGFPGDRCTWIFPHTKLRFQNNREGEAGGARYLTIQVEGEPRTVGGATPFDSEARVNQSTAFLVASV